MTDAPRARDPWERQDGETDRAFAAFIAYRDLGPARRQSTVAEQTGESIAQVYRWSSDHRWAERASDWDDHRDEVRRRAELDEVATMARRHVQLGQEMTEAVLEALKSRRENKRILPASTLAQIAKHGVEIERLARGLPSDVTRTDVGEAREDEDFDRLLEDPRTRSLLVAAASRSTPLEGDAGADGGVDLARSVADG